MKFLFSRLTWLVVFGVVACQIGASQIARGQINLGTAGPQNYGVLNLSGAFTLVGAGGSVVGNVGIPTGSYNLTGNATISGQIVLGTGVSGSKSAQDIVDGGIVTNNAAVSQAATDAKNASASYASLAHTLSVTGGKISSTMTISGVAGQNVLDVTSLSLTNSTLTLSAPAGSTFIINDSGAFSLNLSNIVLAGGLTVGDVLFNVTGGAATFTGPGNATGILLDVNGKISHSLGVFNGEMIGNNVTILSGGSDNDTYTPPPAPATISGSVVCQTCGCLVAGATVDLLNSSNAIVATTTTNGNGAYSFASEPPGTYSIEVIDSPNYDTYTTTAFTFSSSINLNVATIGLTAAPISYNASPGGFAGEVFFATAATWQAKGIALSSQQIQQSDLYTNTYVSGSSYVAYPYSGVIPEFPELGSFNGNVYAIIEAPLAPQNSYNGQTFIDQVGVYSDTLGSYLSSEGISGDYTFRLLFDQQFTGPGTAYSYAFTPLTFGSTVTTPSSIMLLPPVWTGSGTAPTPPAAGTYPAGWMAQGQLQYILPPQTTVDIYVNGGYQDICGDQFTFSICPTVGGPL